MIADTLRIVQRVLIMRHDDFLTPFSRHMAHWDKSSPDTSHRKVLDLLEDHALLKPDQQMCTPGNHAFPEFIAEKASVAQQEHVRLQMRQQLGKQRPFTGSIGALREQTRRGFPLPPSSICALGERHHCQLARRASESGIIRWRIGNVEKGAVHGRQPHAAIERSRRFGGGQRSDRPLKEFSQRARHPNRCRATHSAERRGRGARII